jgi:hypothetical protein
LPKQDNGIFFITINPKTKTHTLQIIKYLWASSGQTWFTRKKTLSLQYNICTILV